MEARGKEDKESWKEGEEGTRGRKGVYKIPSSGKEERNGEVGRNVRGGKERIKRLHQTQLGILSTPETYTLHIEPRFF